MDFIFSRLREKSTWTGLIGLLGALGIYTFSDPLADAVAVAAVAVAAALQMFFSERDAG